MELGGDGRRFPFPSMHAVHSNDLTSLSDTWLNPSILPALLSRKHHEHSDAQPAVPVMKIGVSSRKGGIGPTDKLACLECAR
jgi:hypothetical protein